MSPTLVHTWAGPATITVTARITDDLSGFDNGDVGFYSPSGDFFVDASFSASDRISGTARDGTYQTTMTLSQFSEGGTWPLSFGVLDDKSSNERDYTYDDFVNAGFPASFTNALDATPPAIGSFSLSPTSVNTTAGPATITVTAQITDDLSGLWYGYVEFDSPSGSQYTDVSFSAADRTAGNALQGTYRTSMTVPQGAEGGTWHFAQGYVVDYAYNYRDYTYSDFVDAGFPANFTNSVGPAVEVPSTGFAFPASLGATSVPVVEKWAAASDPNGICGYDLRESVAGGPFEEVALPSPTSTSVGLSLDPSTSYRFEVNVTNCVGQSSGFGVQSSFAPLVWQESDKKLQYRGTWTAQSVAGAYGGALKYSTAANASVSESFQGTGVAWVSETGPTLGMATVFVDGVAQKTVNLYRATLHARQIVWKQGFTGQATHTVKVVVAGTAGHPRVDLDAFLTLHLQ